MALLKIVTAMALLFASFFAAGSAIPIETPPAETIKVGLTLALSGKYAEMGNMQMRGYSLWEREVNKRGGILGKKVQIVLHDDKSDARVAKAIYERLITKDRVDLVFSPYSSEITGEILPITEKYGYPVLTSANADTLWNKGHRYVYGVAMPASKYTSGFIEMAVLNGLNGAAIVYVDDPSSSEVANGARKWAERLGFRVLLFERLGKGPTDFDEAVRKVRASGAQALIVCGHFAAAKGMRLSLKKAGWYPKAYYASVGPALQVFKNTLKEDAEYIFSTSKWEHHGGIHQPGCGAFHQAFVEAYHEEPSYHAAEAYAIGEILQNAVIKAGSLDRSRIRDMLSSMDTMSIIGRYGVDRTGMQIKHFNLLIQWQKGRKEVVWPEDIRTAKPLFK